VLNLYDYTDTVIATLYTYTYEIDIKDTLEEGEIKEYLRRLKCLTNTFEVFTFQDFHYFNEETEGYDWISDIKDLERVNETKKSFKTYREAKEYYNEQVEGINETPNLKRGYNGVSIMDNITGEIASYILTLTSINDLIPLVGEPLEIEDTKFSENYYKSYGVEWA